MDEIKQETGKKTSFWQLINSYDGIEIPAIQRDYAQGRKSKAVQVIRENFISKIKETLLSQHPLDLNFVYGNTDSANKLLIPIDGQQRLTTLFLVHWYIMQKTGTLPENKEIMQKFKYKTRISSATFCRLISDKEIKISGKENISKEIKNNPWFSFSWENDPTVNSMLVMLDEIEKQFKTLSKEELNTMLDLLKSDNCPIFFYFLPLEDYKLDDSIYIKLNARGIALTEYENFKAKLSAYLDKQKVPNSSEIIEKLDNKWAAFFWNYKNDAMLYDDKILNLFMAYIINDYVAASTITTQKEVREDIDIKLSFSQLDFVNGFEKLEQENTNGFTIADSVKELLVFFDLICGEDYKIQEILPSNAYIAEKDLVENIITPRQSTSRDYEQKLNFYAYCRFIIENLNKTKEELKKPANDWFRVIHNLTNSFINLQADNYQAAIKRIKELAKNSGNTLSFLSNFKYNEIPDGFGFDKFCFIEECIKAKLILRSDSWKNAILEAENNPYFEGHIGFLLEFSGILQLQKDKKENIDQWTDEEEKIYLQSFENYSRKIQKIFNKFKTKNGNYYTGLYRDYSICFRRALLSVGDYTLNFTSNKSLLQNEGRDISWNRLLRLDNRSDKRKFIKQLLDNPLFDENNIRESFEKICDDNLPRINDKDGLQYLFLRHKGIMEYILGNNDNPRLIRKENSLFYILLNAKQRMNGINVQIEILSLWSFLKEKGFDCIINEKIKGHNHISEEYHLQIKNENAEFLLKYENQCFSIWNKDDKQNKEALNTEDAVLKYIKSSNVDK